MDLLKFPCDESECDFEATTKKSLSNHNRRHREKKFRCDNCEFKTAFENALTRHTIANHSGSFDCSYLGCSYSATQQCNLDQHLLTHSEEMPYECNLCGQSFRYHFELRNHIRSHRGKKPLRCFFKGCEYSSDNSVYLKWHVDAHAGEKPYKCYFNNCGYASSFPYNLTKHIYTHTGEKPRRCNFKGCDYATTEFGHLKRHFRTHTGEKPYRCNFQDCKYSCKDSHSLRNHKLRHLITERKQEEASTTEPKGPHVKLTSQNQSKKSQSGTKVTISAKKSSPSFSCNFCRRIFAKEMSLLNHLRIHTGQVIPGVPRHQT